MKKVKVNNQFHSSDGKIGMGDSYGTGIRNPVGKPNSKPKSKGKFGRAPKALA